MMPVTKHGAQMPGTQRPQINARFIGYTLLIGQDVRLSRMGKRRMSFASTSTFYHRLLCRPSGAAVSGFLAPLPFCPWLIRPLA